MTERDNQILKFLNQLPCSSSTIQKIFFPGKTLRMANKRLKYLFDYGHVKRTREHNWENYYYYVDRKPKQLMHYDYIARAYLWIMEQGYIINEFEVQKKHERIIPDLIVDISKDNKRGLLPVEVELNSYNLNYKIRQYENSEFSKLLLFSNSFRESDIINIINVKIKDI